MTEFLTYDLKVAVLIAVFYFCYRLLMERETFHRLNRIVLLSSIALSLVLPLCVITFHETVEVEQTTATANPNPQSPITDMSAVTAADSVQMAPVDQSAVIFAIFRVEFYSNANLADKKALLVQNNTQLFCETLKIIVHKDKCPCVKDTYITYVFIFFDKKAPLKC